MPDKPFDRTIINPLEKPLSTDVNLYLSQLDRAVRFLAKGLFATSGGVPVDGFLQGGFLVVESGPAAMTVDIKAGLGFQNLAGDVPTDIGGIVSLNDQESYKPIPLVEDILGVGISAAPGGSDTRIDIIEVRADRLVSDAQSRKVFNNSTRVFTPTTINKTLGFEVGAPVGNVTTPAASTAAISLKEGIAATPGVAPATTPGYIKIAEILVGTGVTTIVQAAITDSRPQLLDNVRPVPVIPTYGEIYIDNGATNQITNPTIGLFNKITLFNGGAGFNGVSNLVTPDKANNEISLDEAGVYKVDFSCSFNGTNSAEYEIVIYLDGVAQTQLSLLRKLGTGGDVGSVGISGFLTAIASQGVDVRVAADGSSRDFLITNANLSVLKVA